MADPPAPPPADPLVPALPAPAGPVPLAPDPPAPPAPALRQSDPQAPVVPQAHVGYQLNWYILHLNLQEGQKKMQKHIFSTQMTG